MGLEEPENMDNIIYFTRRTLDPKGKLMAWACKAECSECHKALMGKPVEKGKVKIRATEYVCPSCGHIEEKKEHEAKLTVCVKYSCPNCDNVDDAEIPFKRKPWKGTQAFVFQCSKCNEKIGVTKRMKAPKKKK